jgi:hypothetical protein
MLLQQVVRHEYFGAEQSPGFNRADSALEYV